MNNKRNTLKKRKKGGHFECSLTIIKILNSKKDYI